MALIRVPGQPFDAPRWPRQRPPGASVSSRLHAATPVTEVIMATKVRVNLANSLELLELPGVSPQQAEAILRFRNEHGPIQDAEQLAGILGGGVPREGLVEQADFSPADATAPEAPGA